MLRDPAEQYESFWRYYIEKRQQKAAAAGTDTKQKKWPDVDGRAVLGGLVRGVGSRVPSMQIREVLGDKCVAQMRQPRSTPNSTRTVLRGFERVITASTVRRVRTR